SSRATRARATPPPDTACCSGRRPSLARRAGWAWGHHGVGRGSMAREDRRRDGKVSLRVARAVDFISAPPGRNGDARVLRPRVFRVLARELLLDAGIMPLPESGKVRRDLNGTFVGREQMQDKWDLAPAHRRARLRAAEVL